MRKTKSRKRRSATRTRARKSYRKNPAKRRRASARRSSRAMFTNPVRRSRRRVRRYRKNPQYSRYVNKTVLLNALTTVAGFVVGLRSLNFLTNSAPIKSLTETAPFARKIMGAIHVALGTFLVTGAKRPMLKTLGVGLVGAGGYDMAVEFFPGQSKYFALNGRRPYRGLPGAPEPMGNFNHIPVGNFNHISIPSDTESPEFEMFGGASH